jgi:hypothetical protein
MVSTSSNITLTEGAATAVPGPIRRRAPRAALNPPVTQWLALSHQAGLIFFHHFVMAITSVETMVQHTGAYRNFGTAL